MIPLPAVRGKNPSPPHLLALTAAAAALAGGFYIPGLPGHPDRDSCGGIPVVGSLTVYVDHFGWAQKTKKTEGCNDCRCKGVMDGKHPLVLIDGLDVQVLKDPVIYDTCCCCGPAPSFLWDRTRTKEFVTGSLGVFST